MANNPKRPSGVFKLAKLIGDIATGQVSKADNTGKDPAAVALGRKGGLRGGQGLTHIGLRGWLLRNL